MKEQRSSSNSVLEDGADAPTRPDVAFNDLLHAVEKLKSRLENRDYNAPSFRKIRNPQSLKTEIGRIRQVVDAASHLASDSMDLSADGQAIQSTSTSLGDAERRPLSQDPEPQFSCPSGTKQNLDERLEREFDRLFRAVEILPDQAAIRALSSIVESLGQSVSDLTRQLLHPSSPGQDRWAKLHERLAQIELIKPRVDRLCSMVEAMAPAADQIFDGLEARLEDIAQRIERIGSTMPAGNQPGNPHWIEQLGEVVERKALQALKTGSHTIEDDRLVALRNDVKDIRDLTCGGDARNTKSFHAIHDTLIKIADKMQGLERAHIQMMNTGRDIKNDDGIPASGQESEYRSNPPSVEAVGYTRDKSDVPATSKLHGAIAAARRASSAPASPQLKKDSDRVTTSLADLVRGRRRPLLSLAVLGVASCLALSAPTHAEAEDFSDRPLIDALSIHLPFQLPASKGGRLFAQTVTVPLRQEPVLSLAATGVLDLNLRGGVTVVDPDSQKTVAVADRSNTLAPLAYTPAAITGNGAEKVIDAVLGRDSGLPETDPADAEALYERGVELERAIPGDLAQAAGWYRQSAQLGFPEAQYRLAMLHQEGRGLDINLMKARIWYRLAAEQGHTEAMHNLAILDMEEGTEPANPENAARWLTLASRMGLVDSQYNLAILYARGVGVDQDPEQSYFWFAVAARQGDAAAAKGRDLAAKSLTPDRLQSLETEAELWKANG